MARRGGFPGGMGNMNNLMKQAQKMQKAIQEQQAALEEKEYTAKAGGGAVSITVADEDAQKAMGGLTGGLGTGFGL